MSFEPLEGRRPPPFFESPFRRRQSVIEVSLVGES